MYHFIHHKVDKEKIEAYFGPFDKDDEFIIVYEDEDEYTLANCVVHIGTFPSLTQARKNNWGKPIPNGYAEHKVGKKRFWTLWPLSVEQELKLTDYDVVEALETEYDIIVL